jgi:hypothetical protein
LRRIQTTQHFAEFGAQPQQRTRSPEHAFGTNKQLQVPFAVQMNAGPLARQSREEEGSEREPRHADILPNLVVLRVGEEATGAKAVMF